MDVLIETLREAAEAVVLVVGIISIMFAPIAWYVRGPRVEIRAKAWTAASPVPWHFAAVDIRNAPSPRWLPITQSTALACRVTLEFRKGGQLAIPPVPARWSARPEPIRTLPVDHNGTVGLIQVPALELIPDSYVFDLPAGGRWEEVAVAVLREGEAFAWGAESYLHGWRHPDWGLDRGEYEVTVIVEHPAGRAAEAFRLRYLSNSFVEFRLT